MAEIKEPYALMGVCGRALVLLRIDRQTAFVLTVSVYGEGGWNPIRQVTNAESLIARFSTEEEAREVKAKAEAAATAAQPAIDTAEMALFAAKEAQLTAWRAAFSKEAQQP